MTSISDDETQPIIPRLISEGLGIAILAGGLTIAIASAAWLSILHPTVPLILQSVVYVGLTAILMLGLKSGSGGHLNPLLTWSYALEGRLTDPDAPLYSLAHIVGAALGIYSAAILLSLFVSSQSAQLPLTELRLTCEWFSALMLLVVLVGMRNQTPVDSALAAATVLGLAYGLSGGTITTNPAITIAQYVVQGALSPRDIGPLILVQFAGAITGLCLGRIIWR